MTICHCTHIFIHNTWDNSEVNKHNTDGSTLILPALKFCFFITLRHGKKKNLLLLLFFQYGINEGAKYSQHRLPHFITNEQIDFVSTCQRHRNY